MISLYSFSCLVALCCITGGSRLCLVPSIRGKALSVIFSVNLSYMAFIMLSYVSFYMHFIENIYVDVEPCHDFSAVEKIMIFRLSFVYVCITVVDLCMLRILCILGAKLTRLVNGFFLMCFLIWFAIFLLRICFHVHEISIYSYLFS